MRKIINILNIEAVDKILASIRHSPFSHEEILAARRALHEAPLENFTDKQVEELRAIRRAAAHVIGYMRSVVGTDGAPVEIMAEDESVAEAMADRLTNLEKALRNASIPE